MIVTRWILPPDFVARVSALLPQATRADMEALGGLLDDGRVVAADGARHPDFVAWVAGVLRRGSGPDAGVPVPLAPAPKPAPAGATLGGVA